MEGCLTNLQEIGWRRELDRSGSDSWPSRVNVVMKLSVPKNVVNFLTS